MGFGEPDGADGRVAEDDGGDTRILEPRLRLAWVGVGLGLGVGARVRAGIRVTVGLRVRVIALGSPPKSRSARRRPAAMATGVSSKPVVVQSPSAKTLGAEVFSKASTWTRPWASTLTPAMSSCSASVTGLRPMAESTASKPSMV